MWKAAVGAQTNLKNEPAEDDDWETDPDFINDVSEQEQRWGSTTIEGSGRTAGSIDMEKLRKETEQADALKKKKLLIEGDDNAAYGYGGKFGVQKDRMDRSAVGHDYIAKVEKHMSQKDYSTGFGGKYGVQSDRVDKSAMSWDHKEKIEKHASQKDYASGFGGKFGVQKDRQDKSAVGWDHVEKLEKHESQKDYSVGFGGKFGVQSDRQDKSAVGWDHHEAPQKHESQIDHKIGFGGKFGVQKDRMDKSALTFDEEPTKVGTTYSKVKPDVGTAKPSDLRAKFEKMSSEEPAAAVSSTVSRSNIQSKTAMFASKPEEKVQFHQEKVPKQLDESKTAFLSQTITSQSTVMEKITPGQLDRTKMEQFTAQNVTTSESNVSQVKQELEQLKLTQQQKQIQEEKVEVQPIKAEVKSESPPQQPIVEKTFDEEIYENSSIIKMSPEVHDVVKKTDSGAATPEDFLQEDEIVDTGLSAIALYDYQAAADDEISFDPEDIISHVEMIDEGWWRGMCKGRYGLFPANYVQLQQ